MKLVWSPETASDAYIDTVKLCKSYKESGVAEFLSATAAGWNARLIVETWSRGDPIATSVGLAVAAIHTCGRHVCIVPDEQSKLEYVLAMRGVVSTESTEVVVVGDDSVENAVEEFHGVDFMVVNSKRREFVRTLRFAKLSSKGAVLVCKNATQRAISGFKWHDVLKGGTRVVRSVILPVGIGLDIAHVGATGGHQRNDSRKISSRWIRHVDHQSGEEHLFRR
ncbi:PREDICTED: uncharacterized protein LOC104793498 [Camelina sativa]|uniref:Uncharacterized protein LOC104793498 n=1 Tax=Camelina sativa TaxID=90675 RepID=A0ABM0ZN97_CAMSA|nr:PREDICTED: uncharacterized protein LOC104793498 [Camelina sativa]